MQMLFDEGREFETVPGLGLIDGYVDRLQTQKLKIPHMGWNELRYQNPCELLKGIEEGNMSTLSIPLWLIPGMKTSPLIVITIRR